MPNRSFPARRMSENRIYAEVKKAPQELCRDFCRFVSYSYPSFFTVVSLVEKRLSTRENPGRPAPRSLQPPPLPIHFYVTTKNTLCQEFSTLRFCLRQSLPSQMSPPFSSMESLWPFCGKRRPPCCSAGSFAEEQRG